MSAEENKKFFAENGENARKIAEKLFRSECIETLMWPPCADVCSSISNQIPSNVIGDVSENLDNGAICTMDPSTYISPVIDEEGNIIDFIEETRSYEEFGSSAVSMSLNRVPFKHSNVSSSIRGSSSNIPFVPGFVEDLDELISSKRDSEDNNEEEFLNFNSTNLLNDIPILGEIKFQFDKREELEENNEKQDEELISSTEENVPTFDLENGDFFELIDFVSSAQPLTVSKKSTIEEEKQNEEVQESNKVEVEIVDDKMDEEIENVVANAPLLIKPSANNKISTGKFAFANVVDTSNQSIEYENIYPTMARKYPFTLDPFQQASVLCMERGESLFVAAHTSAGKTVVAEYAIAMCKAHKTRAIYTAPIKALSNQKFRDFKQIYDDVGLVTGDIQLNPNAFCLIMTTEILRSMLYNGSDVIRDLEWVVFDEVHYINNEERGHVWEEVLIMLPAHVKIVMLSATVPNCVEFADWVGRIKNQPINVISTAKRPVPLEHYLYTGQNGLTQKELFKIIDRNGEFLMKGWNDAKEAKDRIYAPKGGDNNQRGGGSGRRGDRGRGGGNRGGGRGGGGGNGGSRNAPGRTNNSKNIYQNLINYMKQIEQLPMVVFVFSRKRCDEYAQLLHSMDFTSAVEKSHIHKFFAQCIDRLNGSDKQLPQVIIMRDLCLRGFAVHHSGILPILKEVVELLFQKGYVKILFATETFAMGVNMPARCVVFDSIVKHDGNQRRYLNPGEYTQMAGRAGRRGLDSTGTVIVLCKEEKVPDPNELKSIMLGSALKLESKFRVTYSMLLNLLRVEQLKIEDMLQKSYVESGTLRETKNWKTLLADKNKRLDDLESIDCSVCVSSGLHGGIRAYHDILAKFLNLRAEVWPKMNEEQAVNKLLTSGRFLIVSSAQHNLRNDLVVLLKELTNGPNRLLEVLIGAKDYDEFQESIASYEKFIQLPKGEMEWISEENALIGSAKYGINGVRIPDQNQSFFRVVKIPLDAIVSVVKKNIKIDSAAIVHEYSLKLLARFRDQPVSEMVKSSVAKIASVAEGIVKNEIEVYTMADLSRLCVKLDNHSEASLAASYEMELNDANAYSAKYCTRFDEHFAEHRKRVRVEREINDLKFKLSSDSLLLSDEYRNKLKVLEDLNFVQTDKMVNLRGRVACEIHHQELLITELILGYKFHEKPPAVVAALLSTLTCQFNSGKNLHFPTGSVFEEIHDCVTSTVERLQLVASKNRCEIIEIGSEIRFDLMDVVYNWATGVPFAVIMEMTEAQEGLIVKCIQRLDEVCKDVRNAARIVGDPELCEKMEEVRAAIRRDIVFAASLYTSV